MIRSLQDPEDGNCSQHGIISSQCKRNESFEVIDFLDETSESGEILSMTIYLFSVDTAVSQLLLHQHVLDYIEQPKQCFESNELSSSATSKSHTTVCHSCDIKIIGVKDSPHEQRVLATKRFIQKKTTGQQQRECFQRIKGNFVEKKVL